MNTYLKNITLLFNARIRSDILFRTMSINQSDVLIEEINEKGVITLNRPEALNSLNVSMVKKVYDVLKEWESKKTFVLVKGAGGKAFCAGGDVKAVIEAGLKGEKLGQEFFCREYATNGLIQRYKIPYIAIIDGIVMGGGVGLSVHGRYRIATEKTLFAMPETQIGFVPDVGGSYFLPRLSGRLGWYLALTGQRLKGSDVLKAGIATHYCESKNLKELEKSLLECSNVKDIDYTLNKFSLDNVPDFSLKPVLNSINECFSAVTMEEIIYRLKKENSKWSEETLTLLGKMSPTSLKVTLQQLEVGKNMNFQECLVMEYRIALNCLDQKDFYEGVRALLIDKDQSPKWNPATLSEVSKLLVENHFKVVSVEQQLKTKL